MDARKRNAIEQKLVDAGHLITSCGFHIGHAELSRREVAWLLRIPMRAGHEADSASVYGCIHDHLELSLAILDDGIKSLASKLRSARKQLYPPAWKGD